jgi:divalent metal cation (Fe/Co/Zn/Cd) transporter
MGVPERKFVLIRRALRLSYFTVGYNLIEFILSITAGALAGSAALIGFGLDSLVESLSAGIMIWRFRSHGALSANDERTREKRAERLVGYTFLILAGYVAYESATKLLTAQPPQPSLPGIAIAIASIVIMPLLYYFKYRTGKEMKSRSLIADSRETLACAGLSVALLLGLGANYLFGWWQADPVVGIIIVIFLVREGIEILRGEEEEE